jgi:hypothetical protein
MKIEVVSSDQMTLLQWCMNMYKGFCSFPISQKINKLSLGFALYCFTYYILAKIMKNALSFPNYHSAQLHTTHPAVSSFLLFHDGEKRFIGSHREVHIL